MENLKYTLFDLFVYTFPGTLLLFSINVVYFSDREIFPVKSIQYILSGLDVYKAVVFIVFSYCIGFICSIMAGYLLWIKEKYFPIFKRGEMPTGNSKKFIVIRERSKENFKYIEQWNVLKNFAATLSFVLFILTFLFFFFFTWFKIYFFITGLLLSTTVLIQASKYHKWALIDLDNYYKFYIGDGK